MDELNSSFDSLVHNSTQCEEIPVSENMLSRVQFRWLPIIRWIQTRAQ